MRAPQVTEANQEVERRHKEVERQKEVSESLLLNILPGQVARELQDNGKVEPKYFEDVTINVHRFCRIYSFHHRALRHRKLKTIGDSYMCAAGLPMRSPSHPIDTVMAAFEMLRIVTERAPRNDVQWSVRIGIHSGPVIAGVVGVQTSHSISGATR